MMGKTAFISGVGILAYIAFHPFQIGFVVLEVTWTLISIYALFRPKRETTSKAAE